jgi:hypothetical protein
MIDRRRDMNSTDVLSARMTPSSLRWTGIGGVLFALFELVGLGLFFAAGPPPGLNDAAKLRSYYGSHAALLDTSVLLFFLSLGFLVIFVAGLRGIVSSGGSEFEWLGTLIFGIGLVSAAEAFISIGILFAAVADASGNTDPTTVRTLYETSAILGGAPSAIPLAFYLGAVGVALRATRVLPGWTGWTAWIGALIVVLTLPAMYGGNDASQFYTADGVVTVFTPLPLLLWTLATAIAVVRRVPVS